MAGWHRRTGMTFSSSDSALFSTWLYFSGLWARFWTRTFDIVAFAVYNSARLREYREEVVDWLLDYRKGFKLCWRTMNIPQQLQGRVLDNPGALCTDVSPSRQGLVDLHIPPKVQSMAINVREQWNLDNDPSNKHNLAPCGSLSGDYLTALIGLQDWSTLQPAPSTQMAHGTVKARGRRLYVSSERVKQFRSEHGLCHTSKRALLRVISSYQKQCLAGRNYSMVQYIVVHLTVFYYYFYLY